MRKKIAAAVALVASGALVAGVAFAYWSTEGSGSSEAATTAGVTGEVGFDTSAIAAMYPGDDAQPITVTVSNDAAEQSVYIADVRAYVTTDKVDCDGADFLLDGEAAPGTEDDAVSLDWTAQELVAGASDEIAATLQFNDTDENQDACKGAKVTLNYLAS